MHRQTYMISPSSDEMMPLKDKHEQSLAEDPPMKYPDSTKIPPTQKEAIEEVGNITWEQPTVKKENNMFDKPQESNLENKNQIKTDQHTSDKHGLLTIKQSQPTAMSPSSQTGVGEGEVINHKSLKSEEVADSGMETSNNKPTETEPVTKTEANGTNSETVEQRESESGNGEESDHKTEKPNKDSLTNILVDFTEPESLEQLTETESMNKKKAEHGKEKTNTDARQIHRDSLTETSVDLPKPESLEQQTELESRNEEKPNKDPTQIHKDSLTETSTDLTNPESLVQ
ncbi:Hypothetical predicted protein [Pelobates cultripes]|uniref:Uncharacterized protein n=1 Tax=Pelobates cultripes TaxID=61616 RepID=A0AAD1WJ54_PELCU|nr:Hypothetical predicted protein [Pelobates cultripes]